MNREQDTQNRVPEIADLIERYTPVLFRVLAPWAESQEAVEDIIQEVWIKVHRNLPRFQGRSAVFTWIYRIAVNTAMSAHKKRRDVRSPGIEDEKDPRRSFDPEQEFEKTELKQKLIQALAGLRPPEREIFLLRAYENRGFGEIGGLMNSTEGSVRVRYFNAVRKLRKRLRSFVEVPS